MCTTSRTGLHEPRLALIGKPAADKRAFLQAIGDLAAVSYRCAGCPNVTQAPTPAADLRMDGTRMLSAKLTEITVPQINTMSATELPDVLITVIPASAAFHKGKRRCSSSTADNFAGVRQVSVCLHVHDAHHRKT